MSIEIGRAALLASQVAIDITGKNISHANDANYARQRVEFLDSVHGTIDTRIQHAVNISLENDTTRESAILNSLQTQDDVLTQIENTLNELTDNDLSSALDNFYNSLEQLSLNPHDEPLRQSTIENAQKVTDVFHLVSTSLVNTYENLDKEIGDMSGKVNTLLENLAASNVEITKREGGPQDDPAVEQRKIRRDQLVELSTYMDISVRELSNGSVLVSSGGRTLVFQGDSRGIYVDNSTGKSMLRFVSDNSFVSPKYGKVAGAITGRDTIVKNRMNDLDNITRNFAWQMNKVHNTGRGTEGVSKMVAETRVSPNYIDDALDVAEVNLFSLGTHFKPKNGSMTIEVRNETTGELNEKEIQINLVGDNKTTLETLRNQLNQINNLSASIDNVGTLSIESSAGYTFFVKDDTSDVAAFLGLNNFFSGANAASVNVNASVAAHVRQFATGKSADSGDNTNITNMINTKTTNLSSGVTLYRTYEQYVASVATDTNRTHSLSLNQKRILDDVNERRQNYSGVNLDEEAANLLKFQQSYQAAARYMSIQKDLMDELMHIV